MPRGGGGHKGELARGKERGTTRVAWQVSCQPNHNICPPPPPVYHSCQADGRRPHPPQPPPPPPPPPTTVAWLMVGADELSMGRLYTPLNFWKSIGLFWLRNSWGRRRVGRVGLGEWAGGWGGNMEGVCRVRAGQGKVVHFQGRHLKWPPSPSVYKTDLPPHQCIRPPPGDLPPHQCTRPPQVTYLPISVQDPPQVTYLPISV